jgi:ATP-dependent DNA ligase
MARGIQLFHEACKTDLEGIVAKKKDVPYYSDERHAAWVKIKNPQYSQIQGRRELFSEARQDMAPRKLAE